MVLSDKDIIKERKKGNVIISPFKKEYVQPASYDLHLGKEFLIFNVQNHHVIDVRKPVDDLMEKYLITKENPFILHPGDFALGVIYEETGVTDKLVGRLEGKSSLGRLGLIIHTTAGYLDPGNSLNLTLELFNAGKLPIKLYYKMPIGQIAFEYLSSRCEKPYGSKGLNSKYFKDKKPKASMMFKNF